MTEQEKHVNHFLTLFIGEIPHIQVGKGRTVKRVAVEKFVCSCGKVYKHKPNLIIHFKHHNPDFYTPNDRERLFKWMEENKAEIWEEYSQYCLDSYPIGQTSKAIDTWQNTSNLFEFLVEHREDWEWVECPDKPYTSGCMTCKDDTRCNYEGKIQHPAAKYLDSIKEEK